MKPMLILDINFELLHSKVAYNPGSRDKRGGPVIFFHASEEVWQNADANSQELVKLLMYYYELPRYVSSSRNHCIVGNKVKGRIPKRVFQDNKACQIFRKVNISFPLRVRVRISGKEMLVFREIWRTLFSWNTRFEICPFAFLPTVWSSNFTFDRKQIWANWLNSIPPRNHQKTKGLLKLSRKEKVNIYGFLVISGDEQKLINSLKFA